MYNYKFKHDLGDLLTEYRPLKLFIFIDFISFNLTYLSLSFICLKAF